MYFGMWTSVDKACILYLYWPAHTGYVTHVTSSTDKNHRPVAGRFYLKCTIYSSRTYYSIYINLNYPYNIQFHAYPTIYTYKVSLFIGNNCCMLTLLNAVLRQNSRVLYYLTLMYIKCMLVCSLNYYIWTYLKQLTFQYKSPRQNIIYNTSPSI